ncbi:hypothetical protein L0F63_005750 [Massospora cicadina]|nr:hypothetical protein L0F63_005750 [Massospora cicadina]
MGARSSKGLGDVPVGYRLPAETKLKEGKVHLELVTIAQLPSKTSLAICSINLTQLTPYVGQLKHMATIQMCCNLLVSLPREIGYLSNLTHLDLSKNRLGVLPDTIGLLTKLVELKLSDNQLINLPASVGLLTNLSTLLVPNNRLRSVPRELGGLASLTTLNLSNNPIRALPAELGQLQFLRRLTLDGCPLLTEEDLAKLDKQHASEPRFPLLPLKELAARVLVRNHVPVYVNQLPNRVYRFLLSANTCSFCHGPFFSHATTRGRLIEKNDVKVPLEYQLCSPHWKDDRERVSLLFCAPPHRNLSNLNSTTTNQVHPPQAFKVKPNRFNRPKPNPTLLAQILDRTPQLPPKVTLHRRTQIANRWGSSINVP